MDLGVTWDTHRWRIYDPELREEFEVDVSEKNRVELYEARHYPVVHVDWVL